MLEAVLLTQPDAGPAAVAVTTGVNPPVQGSCELR